MVTVKPDLSLNIGKLKLKNPIITASGTFGYADEYEEFMSIQNIGAIVTKGITLDPRDGNPQPRIAEVKSGMLNSIGLENVGICSFIEHKLPILKERNINFILNIAGFSLEEYAQLAVICEKSEIPAIELNVSCPNVKAGCLEFGKDQETLYRLVSSVREVYSNTLIVKLSPNVSNPIEIALAVQKAGADAVSAINTVKGMQVNPIINNGKLEHSYIKGGYSGPAIKPIALSYIHEIKQVLDIPIIGMGGISNVDDVLEFIAVGSVAVQIGTANFTNPCISEQLAKDLENVLMQHNIMSLQDLIEGNKNANNR
ncbi:MAG: dihydroorotate dehydrogenase B catalytic subunit [Candidatus Melainabacteria bacterium RIFOXYA12_FULL_32_12]|nr:MAG: dihydroorotate dehydrogenase B catalytic subunit [Candidatus Melainabacteria bacterium RIFOXYA2_FULL_32_9]OGI30175.1 MAG: dihydroorotate dehydrogenase B catalytic subunit [Candidatus Melainabacteria bacterium RIFOXYA12_FULL_32_12]